MQAASSQSIMAVANGGHLRQHDRCGFQSEIWNVGNKNNQWEKSK